MFAITISEKGGESKRLEFEKLEITIGRVQGNDIILPKGNVSKRHSRIVLKDGKFIIVDLKSTNGTYVNGRKISSPIVVKSSDKIYIGDFVLAVEDQGASEEQAELPPPLPPPAARRATVPPPPPRRPPDARAPALPAVDVDLDGAIGDANDGADEAFDGRRGGGQPDPLDAADDDEETPGPVPVDEPPIPPRAVAPPVAQSVRPEPPRPTRTLSPSPPPPRPAPRPTVMGDPGVKPSAPQVAAAGGAPSLRPTGSLPLRAPVPPSVPAIPARDRMPSVPVVPPKRDVAPAPLSPPAAEAPPSSHSTVPAPTPRVTGEQAPSARASSPISPEPLSARPVASTPQALTVDLVSGRVPAAKPPQSSDRTRRLEALRLIALRLASSLDLDGMTRDQLADPQLALRVERLAGELAAEQTDLPAGTDAGQLAREAVAEAIGNGPIDALLADASITEISIPRFDRVVVVREGERLVTEKAFTSPESLVRAAMRLAGSATAQRGVIEARLADGSHLIALVAPLVHRGAVLTLRRARHDAPTLEGLVGEGVMSEGMADLLARAVKERRNILITGNAGALRGSVVAALAHAVDAGEHQVLIEDREHEAPVDGNIARVSTNGGAREALAAAMRLHPDRIIIDDNHGQAAAAALEAMVASPGTIATSAGISATDGVNRLISHVRLAMHASDGELLRHAVADHLHLVVHVARGPEGKGRVTQIAELERIDDRGRATLASAFEWKSTDGGGWSATGHVPAFAHGPARS